MEPSSKSLQTLRAVKLILMIIFGLVSNYRGKRKASRESTGLRERDQSHPECRQM